MVLEQHRKELKREEWLEGNNNEMKDLLFTGKIKGIKRHWNKMKNWKQSKHIGGRENGRFS